MKRNEIDHEVRPHIEGAKRALRAAVGVCSRVRTVENRREVEALQRRLSYALKALNGSRRSVAYGVDDPDLMSESSKYPGWHRRGER